MLQQLPMKGWHIHLNIEYMLCIVMLWKWSIFPIFKPSEWTTTNFNIQHSSNEEKKIAISLQWAIKKVRLRNEQKLDKINNIWRQIRSEYTCIIGFNHMPLMSTHNNQMMPIFQILLLGHNRLCDFMRRMNHLTNVWILHVQFHIIFKSWLEAFVADQQ